MIKRTRLTGLHAYETAPGIVSAAIEQSRHKVASQKHKIRMSQINVLRLLPHNLFLRHAADETLAPTSDIKLR